MEQSPAPFFPILPSIARHVLSGSGKWIPPGPGALAYLPKLRRFLRREAPSVLVDVDLVLDALSLPAAAGLPTRIVSWEHFHYDFEQQTLYRRMAARLCARFSDYLVTLTPRDAESYREKLGRRQNVQWIYNPLPPELLALLNMVTDRGERVTCRTWRPPSSPVQSRVTEGWYSIWKSTLQVPSISRPGRV